MYWYLEAFKGEQSVAQSPRIGTQEEAEFVASLILAACEQSGITDIEIVVQSYDPFEE